MKKYLQRIATISVLFLALLAMMVTARYQIINHHSWKLSEKVHILFMGASHIVHSVDDSFMEEAINIASPSERYMYTYIKLNRLIEENPQVDTVFLELAATDLWEDTDYKYHTLNEQSHFIKVYWPNFSMEHYKVFSNEPFQVISVILSNLTSYNELVQSKWWKEIGGYQRKDTEIDVNKKQELRNFIPNSGHVVNYRYLRRIINLCNNKGVKLYFIDAPVYNIDQIYDVDYFHQAYNENFSDVEFFDYNDWPISLNERADGSHLNHKGAKRFTLELMRRFGIR